MVLGMDLDERMGASVGNNLQTFTPEFKRDCLAFLLKDQVAAKALISDMPSDLFDYDPEFNIIFVGLQEFFNKYNCRPRRHELVDYINDVCNDEGYDTARRKAILAALNEVWDWDQYSPPYVKDKLYPSVTAHNILKVARQIEEYVDEGDFDGLVEAMSAARSTGTEEPELTEYWTDTDERIKRRGVRTVQNVPTGFPVLDGFINGGLPRGSLAMIQGHSGLGKSALMTQIARKASLAGYTTAYLSLELDSDAVMDRYDAALSNIALQNLVHKGPEVRRGVKEAYVSAGVTPARLYVQYYPTKSISLTQVSDYVDRLREEKGVTLDLLVVDYFDLLKMEGNYTKKYEALEENCEMMRGLAGKYSMALWTATQTNRGGVSKETVGMDDIASGFGKVFPLDLLVTMSQTEKEKKNPASEVLRLTLAKSRLGPSNETIYIVPNFAKMQFKDYDEREAGRKNLIVKGIKKKQPKKLGSFGP
jgi:hypothetical protein